MINQMFGMPDFERGNLMVLSWDLDAAVKHLQTHALSDSHGQCAKYPRQAVEAGGVTLTRHESAKDYGPSLETVGFAALNFCPTNGYAKGDVAIIKAFAGHPHGHMMMYDGTQWISDFKQRTFYPGGAYRRAQPSYEVYRYRTLQARPTSGLPFTSWTSTEEFSSKYGD